MAKITIAGDAMVITSTATLKDIATLEAHRPNALALYDNEGKEVVFKVGVTVGDGSINKYGASFSSASHDEQRFATITMTIPKYIIDAKEYVAEKFGVAIINLNKVEEQFAQALEEVEAEKAAVMENITVA